jgi:hypothetical protein
LLKQYLRNIPGGLTTQAQYGALMDAGRLDDEAERVKAIALIMQYKLPEKNFATLSVIVSHLRNVADMSKENKMEVWRPNCSLVVDRALVLVSLFHKI